MSVEIINNFPICNRIERMGFRDIQTSAIACLAAFLKLSGMNVALDSLLDIAPVSKDGVSNKLLLYFGKRIGVKLTEVAKDRIQRELTFSPILLKRSSGYSLLLLQIDGDAFIAGLPGYGESFARVPFDSDILDGMAGAFALHVLTRGPSLRKPYRPAKLWLLPWRSEYEGRYDVVVVNRHKALLLAKQKREMEPISLGEITPESLKISHLSICPQLPVQYGRYRKINLKRGCTVFVDYKSVPQVTKELLIRFTSECPSDIDEAISLAARFFTDFQTIHPFGNANRRMAALVVTKYLERWDASIRWENISSSQFYYWTRCARQGHFRFLEEGFRNNLECDSVKLHTQT
jgi:prophage maintenance system killer protein